MEDFYLEESSTKEVIKKVIVGLLVVACFILLALYLYNKNTLTIRKTITLEAGSNIPKDVKKYVKSKVGNPDDFKIEVEGYNLGDEVDEVGEIGYKVTYNKITKTGFIKIVDTKAPIVTVEDLTVGLNEDYDLKLFITACEDYSKPCIVTTKNESDETLSKSLGTHTVNLIIEDNVGNKTEKKAKLIVKENYSLEEEKKKDLTITEVSPNFDDFDESKIIIELEEAIDPSTLSDYGYEYMYKYLEDHTWNNLPEEYQDEDIVSQELITAYNRYGYVVGFAIRVELLNGDSAYFVK